MNLGFASKFTYIYIQITYIYILYDISSKHIPWIYLPHPGFPIGHLTTIFWWNPWRSFRHPGRSNPKGSHAKNGYFFPTCPYRPWLAGGFKHVLFSPRTLGKWSNLTFAYFSDGLVQPPTRWSHGTNGIFTYIHFHGWSLCDQCR